MDGSCIRSLRERGPSAATRVRVSRLAGARLIRCACLILLLFAICDRCYPESAFPFISTYKPLAWAGLIVAGIFIWIGRSFPGNELPSRLLRKSNYFLGICLALTELSYLTSSLSNRGTLFIAFMLGNLLISVLAIVNVVQSGRANLEH